MPVGFMLLVLPFAWLALRPKSSARATNGAPPPLPPGTQFQSFGGCPTGSKALGPQSAGASFCVMGGPVTFGVQRQGSANQRAFGLIRWGLSNTAARAESSATGITASAAAAVPAVTEAAQLAYGLANDALELAQGFGLKASLQAKITGEYRG